tara:strand:- start:915 stop:1772 length:858 start_codon:yes stop_codon:yes gene_type:complete
MTKPAKSKTKNPETSIDWGKTSQDYANYRYGQPNSFYEKLSALGIGQKNQKILDIGTGTGLIARNLSKRGCNVSGIDISANQIAIANNLSLTDELDIDFRVAEAEHLPFEDNSFDCVTSSNSWQYFHPGKTVLETKRVLKPDGLLVISHFSWLPKLSDIAYESENLALQYNPHWSRENWNNSAELDDTVKNGGVILPTVDRLPHDIILRGMFFYDEEIPFTKDEWRGRMRASRGIGASLDKENVESFDSRHKILLDRIAGDEFTITHRIDAHIYSFKRFTEKHLL